MKRVILFPLLIILFLCSSCSPKTNSGDKDNLDPNKNGNNGEIVESVDGPGSLDPDRFKDIENIGEMIEKGGDIG
jgi:hypothetical protein